LAAGNISVTVSLAANPTCQIIETITIGDDCVGGCDEPVITNIAITNSDCDAATGNAIISVQGLVSDFTFEWTNNVSTNNTANNLAAGTYEVTIADVNDATCFVVEIITIENVDGPIGTVLSVADATCNAANGSVNLAPATMIWTWADGQTGATRIDLAAGTYFPTVTDANGCENIVEVIVGSQNNLTTAINITAEPNCGLADGIANVTVNNGSGNYSFLWNDGNTAQNRTNLDAGSYSVTVVDNENGCEATAEIALTNNTPGANITANDVAVSCFGANDASADYEVQYESGFENPANIEIVDANGTQVVQTGSLPFGIYCINVFDANGCFAAQDCFEVTQPAQLSATISTENVTCDNNGSITLAINGGNGSYNILWNDAQTGATRTNLTAGTYSATITDVNNCELIVDNIIITDDCVVNCEEPVLANIIANEATCGNADGSATIEMVDDLADLTFAWSNGASTNNTAIGLAAGTYNVTISKIDNTDCQIIVNVTIEEDCGTDCTNPVITTIDTTDATCGENDGTATIIVQGNIANYEFTWSGAVAGNTNSANDLAAGVYTVTVYDAIDNTCSTTQTITIGEDCVGGCDEPVVSEIQTTDATCDNGGSATILMTGNSSDYQFVWSNGGTTNAETNLNTGIYTVTIYDVNDPTCNTNLTIQINEDCDPTGGSCTDPIVTNIETTDATCNSAVGSATITIQGTITDYTFEWSGSNSTSNIANGLAAGAYSVTIYDATDNNCNTTITIQIEDDCVTGGCTDPVVANINTFDATCDEANGSASIEMQGNASDFNFEWSAGGSTTNFATSLPAGDYTVTISNATNSDCETIVNLTIGDDCTTGGGNCTNPVVTDVQTTETTCDEATGIATIVMSEDVSNYNFAWSGGVSTTNVANNLAAGVYTVTIYDAMDATCFTMETVQIGDDCNPSGGGCTDPIVDNIQTTDADCDNGGSAIITMQGDLIDYQILWDNGFSGNIGTNLNPGITTVTIYDADDTNCSTEVTIQINDNCIPTGCVEPVVFEIQTQEATCSNADGAAAIIMQSTGDYNFIWSGSTSTTSTATDLAAGIYSVTISDVNDTDCQTIVTVTIEDDCVTPPGCTEPVVTDIQTWDAQCNEENGSVVLVLDGNPANFNYNWSNGNANQNFANNLVAGEYSVTISDTQIVNCQTIVNFTIIEADCPTNCTEPVLTNINTTDATCGEANGAATIEVEGNIDSYTFTWTSLVNNTNTAAGLAAGTYSVTIADATDASCYTTITIVIGTIDGPQANVTSVTAASCMAANGQATFSDPSFSYLWSDGGSGFMRNDLAAGDYQITITDTNSGCFDVQELTIEEDCITQCNQPTVTNMVIIEPDCGASDGIITLELVGDLSEFVFTWSPNSSNSNIATNLTAGVYSVTITRVDNADCFTVLDIIVPNADSPQADIVSTTNANCTAADGTATLAPAIYDFTWSDGGTGAYRNNLAAGTYTVTVDDAGTSCFTILEVEIGENSPLSGTANIDQQPDCGIANGTVTLTVTGGTGNYIYSWGTGNQQTELAAGTYAVTVTDVDTECSTVIDFVLNDNIIGATLTLATDSISVSCAGEADGQITYQLDFENGFNYPETIEITNTMGEVVTNGILIPGDYCMAVKDAAGCLAAQACFTVLNPPTLSVDVSVENVTCSSLGAINLVITGGTPMIGMNAYTLTWEDNPSVNGQATRNDLAEGMYTVTITDDNNCQVKVDIEITNECDPSDCEDIFGPDQGTLTAAYCDDVRFCIPIPFTDFNQWTLTNYDNPFDGTITGCNFDSLFTYSYTSLPGGGNAGPYTVQSWNVNGTVHSGQFMDINGLVAAMNSWDTTGDWILDATTSTINGGSNNTTYGNITVVQGGTSITAIMVLNTNVVPQSTALVLAPGEHVTYITDTIELGVTDTLCFNADWLPGNPQPIANNCEDNAGEYVLFDFEGDNCITTEAFDFGTEQACIILCDDLGYCDTTYLTITVIEPAELPDADDDISETYVDNSVNIDVLANDTLNGELIDLFILEEPANGVVSLDNNNEIIYIPNEGHCEENEPDQFTYTICNTNGCDTATVYVSVDCELFTIMSGFSPNGDGINDYFHIEGLERIPDNELLIFSRWGNQVYQTKGYQNDWYGTFDGQDLPDGTYFYIFSVGGEKVTGYVQIGR